MSGCVDDLARPSGPGEPAKLGVQGLHSHAGTLEARPALVRDFPEMRVSREHLPTDVADAALIDQIRIAGGIAYIGLKPPTASRTVESGVFPAVSRSQAADAETRLIAQGARVIMSFSAIAALVVEIPPDIAPLLRRLAFVNYIEPRSYLSVAQATIPQDTSWGARQVAMPWVWQNEWVRGQYSNLTILDTGSDYTHRTQPNGDGPAGNLFECWTVAFYPSCDDEYNHGAHVAGIASAKDNQYGYIGIATEPYTTATVRVCSALGQCPTDAVAGGLDWTASNGRLRQVVNLSLGYCEHSSILYQAIAASANAGNLIVAAAGNTPIPSSCSSAVVYPARFPEVVAVAGTLPDDTFAHTSPCGNGSRSGPEVELSAPFWAYSMVLNGEYGRMCGTSMAAPVVAGVAALVWSKFPSLTASDVRQRLASAVVDLGASGRDPYFGYGRIDAQLALSTASYGTAPSISGPDQIQPYATCQWTGDAGTAPIQPVTYAWAVNGVQQPSTGPELFFTAGSKSFTITLTVTDANSTAWTANYDVAVSTWAPTCPDAS